MSTQSPNDRKNLSRTGSVPCRRAPAMRGKWIFRVFAGGAIMFAAQGSVANEDGTVSAQNAIVRRNLPATAPRNVVYLPSTSTERDPQRTTQQFGATNSQGWYSLTAQATPVESENAQPGVAQEYFDSDNWERVVPVPVDPTQGYNQDWQQENGGERLPPQRKLYDLRDTGEFQDSEKPVPSNPLDDTSGDHSSPTIPFTPPKDEPADQPRDLDEQPFDESNDSSFDPHRDFAEDRHLYEPPRRLDWSGFGSLGNASMPDYKSSSASPNTVLGQSGTLPSFEPQIGLPACPPAYQESVLPHHMRKRMQIHREFRQEGRTVQPRFHKPLSFQLEPGLAEEGVVTAGSEQMVLPYTSPNYHAEDFSADCLATGPPDVHNQLTPYYGKTAVPVQRPWVELWRPLYDNGIFSPAIPLLSDVNPLTPQFLLYGDYRTAVGVHRNNGNDVRVLAHRLNLDMDLRLTGTERIHAAMQPLDHNGRFSRWDFSDNLRYESEMDAQFETAFFEGDLGAIYGGLIGQDAPFDLPIAAGLMPMIYQNGIWMEDIVAGVSVAAPWQHSTALNWANYDATFFAFFDQVTSPAFNNTNSGQHAYGTAWFIEAYGGYIEADYAFLNDTEFENGSYHNTGLAYTRRYFERVSNSVRLINNTGQNGGGLDRTADGTILLLENAWLSREATTFIPYANFFYGFRNPQSVARAGAAGGILRNTGILFESDNLTNYPTLDATGSNSYGGAVGVNTFSADFRRQFVAEFAALDTYGDPRLSNADGPQYGTGARVQKALNNWTLVRCDVMYGWRDNTSDLFGSRVEWRWKF